MAVVHGEVGHDHGDWQRHGQDPAQRAQRSHKHPKVGLRYLNIGEIFWTWKSNIHYHVTKAYCGHGHQRPPQAQGDRDKVVFWIGCYSLCIIYETGKDDDPQDKEEDEEHEFFGGGAECLEENLETRRMAS